MVRFDPRKTQYGAIHHIPGAALWLLLIFSRASVIPGPLLHRSHPDDAQKNVSRVKGAGFYLYTAHPSRRGF